jgi:predicted extracellular nuclease
VKAARFRLGACVVLALVAVLAGAVHQAGAISTSLVISQVYGGGGNSGAPLRNDYIELFNRSGADVVVNGWSVQYAATTGTSWQKTDVTGTVPAGGYLLVQEAAGANALAPPLPPADATGTIPMAAGAGKVVVRNNNTLITAGTSCPTDSATVDLVGYGTGTNCFEGPAPTPTISNTSAALRAEVGCTDTDDNSSDFAAGTPAPRNSQTTPDRCLSLGILATATPHDQAAGGDITLTAAVTGATHPPSTDLGVVCDLSWAGLGASAQLYDDGSHGDATSGDNTFSLGFTIPSATSAGQRLGTCTVSDAQSRSASASYTVKVLDATADAAPTLSSHTPDSAATDVPVDSNIGITFSEPVNVTAAWYSISCATSGPHTAVASGAAASYLLNPDTDFAHDETCTVTLDGAQISDQDANDPPDTVAGSPSWTFTTAAATTPPLVVVSEVYGGGGNTLATYRNDFIELYNRGSSEVPIGGWSVQYASAAGTTWQLTPLPAFSLQPGQHFLVHEASGGTAGALLPGADATGTINMSATTGKVALVNTTTALTSCTASSVVDLVGYGASPSCFEGSGAAPAGSNTASIIRKGGGATDTNDNAADFVAGTPTPQNSGTGDDAPTVISRSPVSGAANVALNSSVAIGFSEPVNVNGSWYSISCTTSGAHSATVTGGGTSFTLDPDADFASAETCTVTVVAANVTDQDSVDPPDTMAANDTWSFSTLAPPVRIHDIQGAAHISPKAGQNVGSVPGIVTAKRTNGFYMQDPDPDADPATSEGIFVFTSTAPNSVAVGDSVTVNGRVQEFRPGGASTTNLTTTELVTPSISVLSSGNALPAATVLGTGGRIPPSDVIENDAGGDVETGGVFDPNEDGIDFYETVEGMRVQLNDAVAVGPTNSFGETPIVGDDGAHASVRTARGGLLLRPDDGNPERVIADDVLVPLPSLNVGDHYDGPIEGVMDYNFGNWFVEVTKSVGRVDNGLQREVAAPVGPNELSVATFNFENLDTGDPQSKFDQLAGIVVNNLRSPDIIGGEEVQDNNGATDNGVVDASQTLSQLVAAIQAAGGPTYEWREIDPVNDQDGGEPGGNIRQVFLFRTDRGVSFVERPGGTSTNATGVTGTGASTQLTFSPGRIDPANGAWASSRKPLAAEFMFRGSHVFAIVNHFNSKGGDDPLFGRIQPPNRSSETQRHQQAHLVADFVSALTTADPNANVVVLGDLNDFEFSQTVDILEAAGLHDLMESLPLNQRYSYEFEGNAQVLDHIMFSGALFGRPFVFDPVHVNAEFWDQASDHDPSLVRVTLNEPPTVSAGGPYTVAEGGSVQLSATGSDPEGGSLTYEWDLDNDGIYETAGQSPTFSAAALDGPSSRTVRVRVTDGGGLTDTDTATVNVTNVAPTATFSAPGSTFAGSAFTLALTNPHDPSAADTSAGFQYAFDCGSGYGAFGSSSTASCPTTDTGSLSVGAMIRDKDGGVTESRDTVAVVVTFSSLCDLVNAYTTDAQTISQLCQRLDQAEKATNPTAKNAHLATFRDLVDKSAVFTRAQAETLKRLSLRL